MSESASLVEGFLYLLKAEPTLLDPAPANFTSQDMEHRRLDEVHTCLRCGNPARCAYVGDTELGPRWLDLCPGCDHWLRRWLLSQLRAWPRLIVPGVRMMCASGLLLGFLQVRPLPAYQADGGSSRPGRRPVGRDHLQGTVHVAAGVLALPSTACAPGAGLGWPANRFWF